MSDQENNPSVPEPTLLRYVGEGAYIPGVPARDLTAADIASSGLSAEAIKAYHNGAQPLYLDAEPAIQDAPMTGPGNSPADAPSEEQ